MSIFGRFFLFFARGVRIWAREARGNAIVLRWFTGFENRDPEHPREYEDTQLVQAEEHFFAWGLGGGDGSVERVDDGGGDAEVTDDGGGERGLEGF